MNTRYKKTLLASCISCALSAVAGNAYAEEVTKEVKEKETEVIQVVGIRRSLSEAQDIKRSSSGIVDAISAEDIGKFPDTNIAESLQRIPGISIDRNGGEGQFVTVRGFGPGFNTVLVNGRRMASETGGREFSFDLYPAELISGAEIYKTGVASLQEGGIGATVNLKTARPFSLDDDTILFNAKALYDDNSGEATPQLFGLYSTSFNEGETGVLFSASYQERKSQEDFTNTNGWLPTNIADVPLASGVNANPGNVTTAFIPRETQTGRRIQERERFNIQGVLQHNISDELLLTVDGFYNKFEVESAATMLGSWFGSTNAISNVVLSENGTVMEQDISSEVGILNRLEGRPTETKAIGFNLNWSVNDELTTVFDLSYSSSEAKQSDGNGQAVMGFTDDPSDPNDDFHFDNTGNEAELIYPQAIVERLLNKDSYMSHVAQFGDQAGDGTGGNSVESNVFELKIDNTYEPLNSEMLTYVKFGASYSQEEKTVDIIRPSFDVFCMYCYFTVDVPNELIQDFDTSGLLDGVSPNTFRDMYSYNLGEYIGWQSSTEGFTARDQALGLSAGTSEAFYNEQEGGFFGTRQPDSYAVTESIFAAYADMLFEGELSDMPWKINSGIRFVWTEDKATGNQQQLVGLSQTTPTQYNPSFDTSGTGFISETNDYMKVLPNISFTLNPTEDFVVRFAVSETISRPELSDLAPRLSYLDMRPGSLNAIAGNVNLKPYTSTNLDLSFEYYWGTLNYVSLAVFSKDVQNFIVTDADTVTVSGVAIDSPLIQGDTAINEVTGDIDFNVQRPLNTETAEVTGYEIAAQYIFDGLPSPLDGFGISANATILDSNAEIQSNSDVDTLFAIPGLGNSMNATLFYQKGDFEARVSWNKRDEFLEHLINPKAGVEPVFTEEYAQIDFQVSYQVNENISVFVEGTNVTDEALRKHGRYDNQFIVYRNTGPRYALGIRSQF
jgi:TonB-dependent receptor